jgi:pyruvate dehydrogenase E2 component (dihydrolipoamide acetyltransferase)
MATTEAIDVVMPQMGVSVSEGTVTKWLKGQGDQVEADEPLLEISTDKVDTEVPSPGSGILTEILVQEGQTVDVGTKLAVIGGDGAGAGGEPAAQPEAPPPEPATQAAADASMAAASEGVGDVAPSRGEEPAEPAPPAQAADGAEAAEVARGNGKTFVSPVVAKIAS